MARIIETLRTANILRMPLADKETRPRLCRPDSITTLSPQPDVEIPYIEVGAKNSPMDASPSVLACAPAKLAPRTAKPIQQQRKEDSETVAATQTERGLTSVVFSPLPAE